jgi:HPt (histidine-containing phosphotransfer) domain-containing protein
MPTADDFSKRLDQLWQKHLPGTKSRLATLERALQALTQGELSQEFRLEGVQAAHKLAGSLGSFGLRSSSEKATEIELLLEKQHFDENEISTLVEHLRVLKRDVEAR